MLFHHRHGNVSHMWPTAKQVEWNRIFEWGMSIIISVFVESLERYLLIAFSKSANWKCNSEGLSNGIFSEIASRSLSFLNRFYRAYEWCGFELFVQNYQIKDFAFPCGFVCSSRQCGGQETITYFYTNLKCHITFRITFICKLNLFFSDWSENYDCLWLSTSIKCGRAILLMVWWPLGVIWGRGRLFFEAEDIN